MIKLFLDTISLMRGVEGGVIGEHHASDAQETIGEGSEGTSVRVTASSKGSVAAATAGVVLSRDMCPVEDCGRFRCKLWSVT
jgi:hypothetical protein